jgi:8-oxo-dGTP diphosphatase
MIDFIAVNFYYVFLGWLVLNLIQRRYRARGSKKRTATLFQAILIFILYIGATVLREEGFEPKWIIVPLGAIAAIIYFFRSKIFPYRRDCANCGAKLNMNQIFLYDANLCSNCDPLEQPEETDAEETDAEVEDETEVEADEVIEDKSGQMDSEESVPEKEKESE